MFQLCNARSFIGQAFVFLCVLNCCKSKAELRFCIQPVWIKFNNGENNKFAKQHNDSLFLVGFLFFNELWTVHISSHDWCYFIPLQYKFFIYIYLSHGINSDYSSTLRSFVMCINIQFCLERTVDNMFTVIANPGYRLVTETMWYIYIYLCVYLLSNELY